MSRKQRWLLLSSISLVMVAGGLIAGSFVGRELRQAPVPHKPELDSRLTLGQAMPEGVFVATYGDTVRLQELTAGRRAVLIFLSTTCTPCTNLAAEWRSVFANHGASYDVIGISSEPATVVEAFAGKFGITFPILIDSGRRFADEYNIEASPTLVGIDENGTIAFAEIGYDEGQEDAIRDLVGRF